jgi:hypothetical protein
VDDEQALEPTTDGPDAVTGVALAVGAVGLLVTFLAARLVLLNLDGPFGEHALPALLTSLALSVVAGVALAALTAVLARRSRVAGVALVAALTAAVVVLFPTEIDRHESFVERPNERSACRGLTFDYYPPGTMDASSDVYCVGLEQPLPAG